MVVILVLAHALRRRWTGSSHSFFPRFWFYKTSIPTAAGVRQVDWRFYYFPPVARNESIARSSAGIQSKNTSASFHGTRNNSSLISTACDSVWLSILEDAPSYSSSSCRFRPCTYLQYLRHGGSRLFLPQPTMSTTTTTEKKSSVSPLFPFKCTRNGQFQARANLDLTADRHHLSCLRYSSSK